MKIPAIVFGATLFIAAVGFADDVHSIPVLPRLLLQAAAVAAIVFTAPESLRIVDDASTLDRTRPRAAGRTLVREPRQLHGRAGPDDGRRGRSDQRRHRPARLARRGAGIDDDHSRRAVRRAARLHAVQPAGGEDLSRRRRQPADRPVARLVPAATGLAPATRSLRAAAAVLPDRCHRDARPAA